MAQFYIPTYKIRIRIILVLLVLLLFVLLFNATLCEKEGRIKEIPNKGEFTPLSACDTLARAVIVERENITFILGDDEDPDNRYYEEADNYYRTNPEGHTEYVLTNCRSLLEVRNYLAGHIPENGEPWGLINLVSHGNQWLGLSAKVTPASKRATAERILEAIKEGSFPALAKNVIDSGTTIFMHGCGLGNNPELLRNIALAFGGENSRPHVKASRLFEYYITKGSGKNNLQSERFLAQEWHVFGKMGGKTSRQVLEKEFLARYSNLPKGWLDVLYSEAPAKAGEMYVYSFEVPVKFTIKPNSADSIPDWTNEKSKLRWILSQKEITETLKNIQIPAEKFTWTVTSIYEKGSKGSRTPALWVKGYCTVWCLIKPLINESEIHVNELSVSTANDDEFYLTCK
jgi:hypothetical protein